MSSEQDPVTYLLHRRFPAMEEIGRAMREAGKSGSPAIRFPTGLPIRETLEAAKAYREDLSKLSESELAVRYREEREKHNAELEQKLFFHQPYADADFPHWAKAAYWTVDEAIALSLGKSPEHVNWATVEPHIRLSPFAYQYDRRRDLALRAVSAMHVPDPVAPAEFFLWAKKLDLAVPPELESALAAIGVRMTDWKAAYNDLQMAFKELEAAFSGNHAEWMALTRDQRAQIDRLSARIANVKPTPRQRLHKAFCRKNHWERASAKAYSNWSSVWRLVVTGTIPLLSAAS